MNSFLAGAVVVGMVWCAHIVRREAAENDLKIDLVRLAAVAAMILGALLCSGVVVSLLGVPDYYAGGLDVMIAMLIGQHFDDFIFRPLDAAPESQEPPTSGVVEPDTEVRAGRHAAAQLGALSTKEQRP